MGVGKNEIEVLQKKEIKKLLTPKEEAFCREIALDGKKYNAAYFSAFSIQRPNPEDRREVKRLAISVDRLMRRPEILNRIVELKKELMSLHPEIKDQWLVEVAKIAFLDSKELYNIDREGNITEKNVNEIDGQLISIKEKINPMTGQKRFTYEPYDKEKALKILGDFLKAGIDKATAPSVNINFNTENVQNKSVIELTNNYQQAVRGL